MFVILDEEQLNRTNNLSFILRYNYFTFKEERMIILLILIIIGLLTIIRNLSKMVKQNNIIIDILSDIRIEMNDNKNSQG